jgi:diadenosine tetraphosphate (Ap4A) HIT family hydrolase
MPPAAMAALGARLPLVADAVVSGMNADNFNILQNNGLVAGQVRYKRRFIILLNVFI